LDPIDPIDPIEKILLQQPTGVLSLVGGGGKTSIMFHLARQLASAGKRVLTTTTTKIFYPTAEQNQRVLVDPDPAAILRQISHNFSGHITAAAEPLADGTKLKGFSPEIIGLFAESGCFDWILVEADGSARRPLKASAEHEPVIPAGSSVLLAVAGLEILDRPLSEEIVFRSSLAADLMGITEGDPISESALARLFSHPLGAFKGAPDQTRRFIFLNKADDLKRREAAARIASLLRQNPQPVAESLLVGQALDGIKLHAEHPLMTTS
jgi:probable selenium-dependent hydroxylase accessory protein YqeC